MGGSLRWGGGGLVNVLPLREGKFCRAGPYSTFSFFLFSFVRRIFLRSRPELAFSRSSFVGLYQCHKRWAFCIQYSNLYVHLQMFSPLPQCG